MKKLLLLTTTLIGFTLSVQAGDAMMSASHNWNNGLDPFKAAISAAKSSYKAVLKVNMAWRDTAKMIKKAEKLHKKGKVDAAIKLANKAHKQSINAMAQAKVAGSAGPRF